MNQLKNVYIFFSLSLLFIFAGCSFFLLNAQLLGTQKLENKITQDSEIYTPIAYLTQKQCPNCKAMNSAEAKFCSDCGTKLN